MDHEKPLSSPLIQFRCPPAAALEFLDNLKRVGWRKEDVLRSLVHSVNELFKRVPRPVLPLIVSDAQENDLVTTQLSPEDEVLKKKIRELIFSSLEEIKRQQALDEFAALKESQALLTGKTKTKKPKKHGVHGRTHP
jgi:hypothetical protein